MFGFLTTPLQALPKTTEMLRAYAGLPDRDEAARDRFASWLPYLAFLPAEELFRLKGKRLGFVLEAMPQSGADQSMVEVLSSLYANCKPGTGIQIHLFGSPHVHDQLLAFANLRPEDADQYARSCLAGRPVRNDNL